MGHHVISLWRSGEKVHSTKPVTQSTGISVVIGRELCGSMMDKRVSRLQSRVSYLPGINQLRVDSIGLHPTLVNQQGCCITDADGTSKLHLLHKCAAVIPSGATIGLLGAVSQRRHTFAVVYESFENELPIATHKVHLLVYH